MKVLCISAANMKHAGDKSTSLIACQIIEKIIKTRLKRNDMQVDIIRLVDVKLKPCSGCGKCFQTNKCSANDDFNTIYYLIADSDAIFIVSPHYTPIPAKLTMLLEKMEQISFLHWFHVNSYKPIVYKKPVGIIAHVGGSEDWSMRSYKAMVLDTIENSLQTIMMDVVGVDDKSPNGVVFPVKEVLKKRTTSFRYRLMIGLTQKTG